jgi:hypothetical protein
MQRENTPIVMARLGGQRSYRVAIARKTNQKARRADCVIPMSQPSFYALFSRSEYRQQRGLASTSEAVGESSNDSSLSKTREEKERFAVATIAFCLKYDERFKRHFLSLLLPKCSHAEKTAKLEIQIGPRQSSDLILKLTKLVIVIEHKIDDDLQPHQNPWRKEFKEPNVRPQGYAVQIRNQHRDATKILYRVLSKQTFRPREYLALIAQRSRGTCSCLKKPQTVCTVTCTIVLVSSASPALHSGTWTLICG